MADHSAAHDHDMEEDDSDSYWDYEYHDTETEVRLAVNQSLHDHNNSHAVELLRNGRSFLCHKFISS